MGQTFAQKRATVVSLLQTFGGFPLLDVEFEPEVPAIIRGIVPASQGRSARAAALGALATFFNKSNMGIVADFNASPGKLGGYSLGKAGRTTIAYAGETFVLVLKPPGTVAMGPRAFDIEGVMTTQQYADAVRNKLSDPASNIPTTVAAVMASAWTIAASKHRDLTRPPLGIITLGTIDQKLMKSVTKKELATINKEFGEVMGPLLVNLSSTVVSTNFPASMTMGLYDFSVDVVEGPKKILVTKKYSSKAATSGKPNTIKPQSMIEMVQQRAAGANKIKIMSTTEYKILQALASGGVSDGPVDAVKPFKGPTQPVEAAKFLQDRSKTTFDFSTLFSFALSGELLFIKFGIKPSGQVIYQIIDPSLGSHRPSLRAKEFKGGLLTERMGLTPP